MPKPLLGVILGVVIGFLDGLTSWWTPKADEVFQIGLWSSGKGLIIGLILGIALRKVDSVPKGIYLGLIVALFFSFLAALGNYLSPEGVGYWVEIMLPGAITGCIIGYATQKFGKTSTAI